MTRIRQLLRGLAALAATAVFTAGIPAGLIRYVGWPLPTRIPTLDEIQLALRSGIDPQLLVKTLAVVVWVAWAQALVATLGSLYFSEVMLLTPCMLCWYQRIAMYPLSVMLAVAALRRDLAVRRYAFPLALIGASIAAYHYLLERFPTVLSSGACSAGVPCTTVWVWQFHYISIPFMALSGFALIITLLLAEGRRPVAEPVSREPAARILT